MTRNKNPFTYPHRSREAMVEWMESAGFDYGLYVMSWNVKAHYTKWDFDTLYKHYVEHNGELNPTQLAFAKKDFLERYGEQYEKRTKEQDDNMSSLEQWAFESAQSCFTDSDAYSTLWDGTQLDVKWQWEGRQSGYVVVTKFGGYDMKRGETAFVAWAMDKDYYNDNSFTIPFKELRTMYKFMREMDVFLTPENASKEVEYSAMNAYFLNIIGEELEKLSDQYILLHPEAV